MYDISVILCDWRDTAVLVLGRVKIEKGEFHMIYDSRERERESLPGKPSSPNWEPIGAKKVGRSLAESMKTQFVALLS